MGDMYIKWEILIYYEGFPYNISDSGMVTGYEIDYW